MTENIPSAELFCKRDRSCPDYEDMEASLCAWTLVFMPALVPMLLGDTTLKPWN